MTCKHDFRPWFAIPLIKRPRGYSKCTKCGAIRHDADGEIIYR